MASRPSVIPLRPAPPSDAVPPPGHLRPATKAWWRAVLAEYQLEPHHRRLLQIAAESWDRGQEARRVIQRNGLTYDDRFGNPKVRPEVAVERDARLGFMRAIRELDLDVDAPGEERTRPPALRRNRRA